MTRKDYIAIAGELRHLWKSNQITPTAAHIVADGLCVVFKRDNARFNPERFMDAAMAGQPMLEE